MKFEHKQIDVTAAPISGGEDIDPALVAEIARRMEVDYLCRMSAALGVWGYSFVPASFDSTLGMDRSNSILRRDVLS